MQEFIQLASRNLKRNQSFIEQNQTPLRDLLSVYETKEWVLAGAGPGLDGSLEKIRRLKEKGWNIAACDMAYFPLKHGGLTPDIIYSCELRPYDFFPGFMRRSYTREQVAPVAILPATVHPYQVCQIRELGVSKFSFINWAGWPALPGLPELPPGGNVYNLMLTVLGALRGGTLSQWGNDLSYPGYQLYARGAARYANERLSNSRVRRMETIAQQRLRGLPKNRAGIPTTEQFMACEEWQNDYLIRLKQSGHVKILTEIELARL